MKAKINRGSKFRETLNYVFDAGRDATGLKNPERAARFVAGVFRRSQVAPGHWPPGLALLVVTATRRAVEFGKVGHSGE